MSKMWERADFWPAERVVQPIADDFARGLAEGRRTVEAELAGEREALLQLASSLETLAPPSSGLIAALIVDAVERLVHDVAGQVPIDGVLLRERADALSTMVAGEGETLLAVHPDHVMLFDGPVQVIGDPKLDRGTVQVRIAGTIYEDGVMPALERLRAEIVHLGFAA